MEFSYNGSQRITLFETNFNFKSNKLEWLWEYVARKFNMAEGHFKDFTSMIVKNSLIFFFTHKGFSLQLSTNCILIMAKKSSENN